MRLIPARLWAFATLSGLLQLLPFPLAGPVPIWRTEFCWVALAPLLFALLSPKRDGTPLSVKQGAALGYLCGFVWYLGNCYWIYQTMYLYGALPRPVAAGILVLFCLYLGLYHALFASLVVLVKHSRLGRQGTLLLAPFLWVSVELARARITGLPWDLFGIAQVDNPLLTRLAPFTGAYGLSFLVAAVNSLWLMGISGQKRHLMRAPLTLASVAIIGVIVSYGLHVRPQAEQSVPHQPAGTAILLQQNLEVGAANTGPQESAQQLLEDFSRRSLRPSSSILRGIPELAGTLPAFLEPPKGPLRADLIVWPESPAPFEEQDPSFRSALSALAQTAGASIIVGNTAFEPSSYPRNPTRDVPRNRASFVTAEGAFAGHYDKMHLVPFGEYTPFKPLFFFAGSLLQEVGIFEPGQTRSTFYTGEHRIGVFICYESIFADEIRQLSRDGAEVLVNISNDGWYGNTSAPWQHLNMVRMRAIENHRWILRSTNTGVTAAIDPYGQVVASVPRHIRTALPVRFRYEHDVTFYAQHGDLFAYTCALVTTLAVLLSMADLREKKRPHSRSSLAVQTSPQQCSKLDGC